MCNVLGLDVGDKRVGTAILAPDGGYALPHATFDRAGGEAERAILELVGERSIDLIVAGLPLNDDGTKNEQCLKVENFCRRLQKRSQIKVVFVDEFATSAEAEESLAKNGVSRKKARGKGATDSLAAKLILELFIKSGPITVPEN